MSNDNLENKDPTPPLMPAEQKVEVGVDKVETPPKEAKQDMDQPISLEATEPLDEEEQEQELPEEFEQDGLVMTTPPLPKGGFQTSTPVSNQGGFKIATPSDSGNMPAVSEAHDSEGSQEQAESKVLKASTTPADQLHTNTSGYQPKGTPSLMAAHFSSSALAGPIFVDTIEKNTSQEKDSDKPAVSVADRIYRIGKSTPAKKAKESDPLGKPTKPSNAGENATPEEASPGGARGQETGDKEDTPFGQSMIAIVQAIALMFKRLLARIINAFRGRTAVSPEEYEQLKKEEALREKNRAIKKQMDMQKADNPDFGQKNLMTPSMTHFSALSASSIAAIKPTQVASNDPSVSDAKSNVIDFKAFVAGMAGEEVANSPEVQALIEAEQENADRVLIQLSQEQSEGQLADLEDAIKLSLSKGKVFSLSDHIGLDMKSDLNALVELEGSEKVAQLANRYIETKDPIDLEMFNSELEILTAESMDREKASAEDRLREVVDSIIEASDSSLKHHPIERVYAVDMLVEGLPNLSRFEGVYDNEDDALLATIGQELAANHSADVVIYSASRDMVADLVESSREVALAQAGKTHNPELTNFKESQRQKQQGGFTVYPYEPAEQETNIPRPRG